MATITFQCYSCKQTLKVGADKAGKKAKCVKCGTILTIPAPEEEEAIQETPPPRSAPKPPPLPSRVSKEEEEEKPRKPPRDDDEEYDEDRPRKKRRDEEDEDRPRRRREEDDDWDEDRPRKKRRDEEDEDRPRRRRDEDEDYDDDRPRKRRREDEEDFDDRPRTKGMSIGSRWAKVRIGLLLTFISACILIGFSGAHLPGAGTSSLLTACILIGFSGAHLLERILFYIGGALARSPGMIDAAQVISKIAITLYFLLQLPLMVGYVFTIFTPNKGGALGFSITSIILGGINLVIKLLIFIKIFDRGGMEFFVNALIGPIAFALSMGITSPSGGFIIAILWTILLDSEWIIFPLYLRSVGINLKDRYLAGGAFTPMYIACGVIGFKVFFLLLILILQGSNPGRGGSEALGHILFLLGIATMGLQLFFSIVYMGTQKNVRNAIDY